MTRRAILEASLVAWAPDSSTRGSGTTAPGSTGPPAACPAKKRRIV